MSSVHYVAGDATQPQGEGPKIIAHICNDVGAWGAGFVLAISRRWPEPEKQYRKLTASALGDCQLVQVEPNLWVANLIAQHGTYPQNGVPPIRYVALDDALYQLSIDVIAHDASVHMPRIGCGLAGGTWDQIEPIIQETLCDEGIPVWVYDLPR
jgi:O-acetyl-ADP-ribose deacetylase (regulator of RNase III)